MRDYLPAAIIMLLALILFELNPLGVEETVRVLTYQDHVRCKRGISESRDAVCVLEFPGSEHIKALKCKQGNEGLTCFMSVTDDFETPGFLKDLL